MLTSLTQNYTGTLAIILATVISLVNTGAATVNITAVMIILLKKHSTVAVLHPW